jgi:UDP-N-acetyl-D-mannosaminuronic acid dehydrogenase
VSGDPGTPAFLMEDVTFTKWGPVEFGTFSGNKFPLGQAAMLVNEGQPDFLVELLEREYDLENMKVGILGMAFKGESDDIRSSLAYKLKKILKFRAGAVLTTDPYVRDDDSLLPLDQVVKNSDLLIIAAPHKIYSSLEVSKPIIDIWNLRK